MSINRVVISGNLTKDAELRQTASGVSVLQLGVAVNDRRHNSQTDEWEDYANFVDCTMWGHRAQAIAPYLRKGLKVAIEGKLRYSSWETPEGQKRSKLEVAVDEIEFMSQRQDGGYQPQQPQQRQPQRQPQQRQVPQNGYAQAYPVQQNTSVYDSDIPF